MRCKFSLLLLLAVLFTALWPAAIPVQAQTATPVTANPYELIALFNQLRAARGNAPLQTDNILMGTAQYTAQVMASTRSCSHIGDVSGRVMAAGYGGGGMVYATENIACGRAQSAESIVYGPWADDLHMLPATNANYQHVGVGMAEVDGYYYYVLHAAYPAGGSYAPATSGTPIVAAGTLPSFQAQPQATQRYISSVQTTTPRPDGSIIHVVQYGQTLVDIAAAYGITVPLLMQLNGLGDSSIREGQSLFIQNAVTPTPSLPPTNTPKPPTRTPTPTRTLRPPTATRTITPTPTATVHTVADDISSINPNSRRAFAIGMIVVCSGGLLAMGFTSLRARRRSKP